MDRLVDKYSVDHRRHVRKWWQILSVVWACPATFSATAAHLHNHTFTVIAEESGHWALVVWPDSDPAVAFAISELWDEYLSYLRGWSSLILSFFWFSSSFLSFFSAMSSTLLLFFLLSLRCSEMLCLESSGPEILSFSATSIFLRLCSLLCSALLLVGLISSFCFLFYKIYLLGSVCSFLILCFSFSIFFLRLISKGIWLS